MSPGTSLESKHSCLNSLGGRCILFYIQLIIQVNHFITRDHSNTSVLLLCLTEAIGSESGGGGGIAGLKRQDAALHIPGNLSARGHVRAKHYVFLCY